MDTENRCPACNAELAANAPRGLCPACLLKRGLESQTEATEGSQPSAAKDFIPPLPADLAPFFPDLEILELLGRGGMGVVYKARQKRLNRLVALKILLPKTKRDLAFAERFAREARALAMLNHTHIVAVYDFGQAIVEGDSTNEQKVETVTCESLQQSEEGYKHKSIYYFLMEFVDGVNLRHLMDAKQLSPKQALAVVPQICDALQFAHDAGVVHRDIKPENILLDKRGRIKIADFGIAKLLGHDAKDQSLTGADQIIGTPQYMAPEQIERPLDVDHRADIYSLGVVFYQMLTGELPIGRFSPPSKKVQIDVRLDEVVLRALEKEPEQRYQRVSEIKTQVESIATSAAPVAPQATSSRFIWTPSIDYRSRTRLFGLPLVHVATGLDPKTGRRRIARGIVAIGDKACGVIALGSVAHGLVAIGGIAMGGIAAGGFAIGVVAFGGIALALLAVGAMAAAVIGAAGGLAIAPVSAAGCTIGYFASGPTIYGVHVNWVDQAANQFFAVWGPYINYLLDVVAISATIILASTAVLAPSLLRRLAKKSAGIESPTEIDALEQARLRVRGPAIGLLSTGIFNLPCVFCSFLRHVIVDCNNGTELQIVYVWMFIVWLLIGVLLIFVGLKMQRLDAYGIAVAVSILIIANSILFFHLPTSITGLPFGLWALLVLCQPSIRMAFQRAGQISVNEKSAAGNARTPQFGIGVAAFALCIAAIPGSPLVGQHFGLYSAASFELFFSVMIVAFVMGIVGWKSLPGKVAVIGSSILILTGALSNVVLKGQIEPNWPTINKTGGEKPCALHNYVYDDTCDC